MATNPILAANIVISYGKQAKTDIADFPESTGTLSEILENGTLNYYSVKDDEIIIHVDGDTAEMTGRSRVNAAVYGGGHHTWRLQMKSTPVKKDGHWLFLEQKASTY